VTLEWAEFGKTYIIALRRSTLKKKIHHVIKFSFVFGLTDSLFQLNKNSTNMKIESDYMYIRN